MHGVYIVAVALIAAVSSSSLHDLRRRESSPHVKSALDDKIKEMLENIKKNMDKSQFGLPPLDPFTLEHLDIDIDQPIATLKGDLDNFRMTKLSTFVVNSVKLNVFALSLSFNVSLADLDFSGLYDITGSLGGDLLPVYGKGPFEVDAGDIWVSGEIKMGSNNSYIYVKSFGLDYHLGYVHTNITGLLGGGDLSELINQVLSDFIPTAAEKYKPKISELVSDTVITMANKMLDGMTLQDILDLINGKTTTAKPSTTTQPTEGTTA